MKVADVMTQEVISVTPDTTVSDAAKLMLKEHVSGLPVITASRVLVGIVTEGDFLRRTETGTERRRPHWLEFILSQGTLAGEYVHSHARTVFDVMTRNVVVATEDMPLDAAVELMERKHVKRLPVVREGKVVGILARANLLHALAASPPKAVQRSGDDAIRQSLESEVKGQPWSARQFHFVVKDGVVDLWGFVTSEQQRAALRVAAENIAGVKEVRDHMFWFEPYSGVIADVETKTTPAKDHI
ncbi:MAG: CBS domain-containing protein [Rhodospirillaceae bacterium]